MLIFTMFTGFIIYGLLDVLIFLCMGLCSGECARSISTVLYETINTTMAVHPSVGYTRNELMSMRSFGVKTARLAPSVYQRIKDIAINTLTRGCRAVNKHVKRIKPVVNSCRRSSDIKYSSRNTNSLRYPTLQSECRRPFSVILQKHSSRYAWTHCGL